MSSVLLERLCARLGYTTAAGWMPANEFDRLTTHRFAMQQAREEMNLVGAFCLMRPGADREVVSTPIVYVASGATLGDAQEVHRRVWSQGLAPFLLILTPNGVVLCPGFSYSREEWASHVRIFDWSIFALLPLSPTETGDPEGPAQELWDLRAVRLRTSLFWRDHSIDVDGRVDRRLLDSLNALSMVLTKGKGVSRALSPAAANSLIGRFLYVFFLADRGIIDQAWVTERGHEKIALGDQFADWPTAATWALFDDLDSIFNGSIFPLLPEQRREIDDSHVNLVRRVMKHGAEPHLSGGVQLNLFDIYLGALRTETLSSIYEQFLENLKAGERRRSGAFYTPPFLVDFMLDRLEESIVLTDGVTVLDPAAGSGVFLVGVYRRIIERARWTSPSFGLSLADLRGLLVRNVFGIERNLSACHVAAFSLYLTLLDYVDPRDLTRVAAGEDPEKLFPPLIGTNILPIDFFSDTQDLGALPNQVSCVVGNPPWQAISKLESQQAENWRDGHKREAPIGNDQAAELFVWKALECHLAPGGVLAFLLPAKSFINPTSEAFRLEVTRRHTVIGAANFAHLRYRLFASARQAVVAAFIRARPPVTRDATWIYSPLSVGQPLARKQWPWTIVYDRADIQTVRHDVVARDPRGWFDAFMLRPVDRQIRQLLDDGVVTGRISTLHSLCAQLSARISRGGNPEETGVDRQFLMDAPGEGDGDDGHVVDLLGGRVLPRSGILSLPIEQQSKVRPSYRNRFLGNVLLVPRNLKNIRVERAPVAYTSSTMAMFYDKPAKEVSRREIEMLNAISRFLRSDVGLYLVATTGRRWLMDRRNVEPEDLKALSVPITGVEDERIDRILAVTDDALDGYLLASLGLDGDLGRAVREFLDFRIGFRDGEVPRQALSSPAEGSLVTYLDVVSRTLEGLIGRSDAFEIEALSRIDLGVATVAARFRSANGRSKDHSSLSSLCQEALERYAVSGANSFTDSLALSYLDDSSSVTITKPLEYFRWTVDSAFADSRQIMNAFVAGRA